MNKTLFKILRFVFIISFLNIFGQSFRFVYKYNFIKDLNSPKNVSTEIMFLDTNESKSQFYSYVNYNIDSTKSEFEKKDKFFMAPNKEYLNFRIKKDLKTHEVNLFTKINSTYFNVTEDRVLKWKLTNKRNVVLGHNVLEATVIFAGRQWFAWFDPEITIQDGPYKFFGLPGLILKIEDESKTHIFTIVGIEKIKKYCDYPSTEESKSPLKISNLKYNKLFKIYRNDPLKDLRGRFPDQTDSEGNFQTGAQVFREVEKLAKDRIRNNNNIIEYDLITK